MSTSNTSGPRSTKESSKITTLTNLLTNHLINKLGLKGLPQGSLAKELLDSLVREKVDDYLEFSVMGFRDILAEGALMDFEERVREVLGVV